VPAAAEGRHFLLGVMTMEIDHREMGQRDNPQNSPALRFPPLPQIPFDSRLLEHAGGFRKDVLGLFIDYLSRERSLRLKDLMETIEKGVILKALRKCGGNQKEAAHRLGIKYTTLNQKVKKYGIRFQRGIRVFEA
jgi:transcriptional regulator of acetoin/glycerol metabolism